MKDDRRTAELGRAAGAGCAVLTVAGMTVAALCLLATVAQAVLA